MPADAMRALRMVRWGAEPQLLEVPAPSPGPGEVLVKVDAAGLCHTDLHLMEWPEGTLPYELPFTLGHETAGTVAALGPGASSVAEGDRVLVYARWGCGRCWQCLQGRDNFCARPAKAHGAGVGRDGGLADYLVVPSARYLVPTGDLEAAAAAPLTDAALTPYHAIKQVLPQLRPGSATVVIGVGGLGHFAVQLLRALSPARVVAVDLREDALALARRAGAHAALSARELTAEALHAEVGADGASVVLDCVATDATLALAAGVVMTGGDLVYLGRGGGVLPVAPGRVPFECMVRVPTWGTLAELVEVVELARAGAIRTEVERFPLEEALEAYGRLHRGEIVGRAVVTPGA